jgi:hypothetical protein
LVELLSRLDLEVTEKTIRQTNTGSAGLGESGAKFGE